jgi:hypothetical protein
VSADFAPSPAVESVHRDDPYGARDGYRSPYVLEEDYRDWDEARLERQRDHAPASCDWAYADTVQPRWGRPRDRFWASVKKDPRSCWEWQGHCKSGGYGYVRWRGPQQLAHRVAWELEVGPIPEGLRVLHKCDNPPCVRPDHLFLGTQADNVADMVAKGRGRAPRGAANANAKLSIEQVVEIRRRYADGEFQTALAREFGVSAGAVAGIVHRRRWAHVGDDAQHDLMLLDRRREHRPPACWECSQAEWLAVIPEQETA